jgi:hypothetical protein
MLFAVLEGSSKVQDLCLTAQQHNNVATAFRGLPKREHNSRILWWIRICLATWESAANWAQSRLMKNGI